MLPILLAELAIPMIDVALTTVGLELGLGGMIVEGSTFGGPVIAGLAAIAVGAWEYFDHKTTVARNKPILRQQIDQYLKGFEADQLKPTGAIGSPIHQIKVNISQSVGSSDEQ